MRREGRVSGIIRKPYFREMVKVQKRPTNASKFSGRCGLVRCCNCHDAPVSKSKAKTKGRNKRALLVDDDWVLRPPLIISGISNTGLLDHDYDADVAHGDVNNSTLPVVHPFCDEAVSVAVSVAALLANLCTAAGHEDVYNKTRLSVEKGNDSATDSLVDLVCASKTTSVQHFGKHGTDLVLTSNHVNPIFTHPADVHQLEEIFVSAGDLTSGEDDARIWDHKMFTCMEDADISYKGDTSCKDDNCADDPFETSCGCCAEETLSDTESEKTSIGDDWCHVMPLKIIDDWCLC